MTAGLVLALYRVGCSMTEFSLFDTRWLYTLLVGLVAAERGVELFISRRNLRWALRHGGYEVGSAHYPWMVVLHLAFLAACPLEVWLLRRPFHPFLAGVMMVLLGGAMALRYWVLATLKERWTTRVICLPGVPPVTRGPYRWLRHPNYLAVVVEMVALPLIHTAWLSALVFGLLNGFILRVRIEVEEAALRRTSSYDAHFAHRPRLLPFWR